MSSTGSAHDPVVRLIAQAISLHEAAALTLGINPTDLRCLALLAADPTITPSQLAEVSGLTTGAITGVLDRLEKAGYVTREIDSTDRRRQTLRLNEGRLREVGHVFGPTLAEAKRIGVNPYLPELADTFAREAARLSANARGGMVGDEYVAPLGSVARAQLVVNSGAPRVNIDKQLLGQQLRVVAETAATRLRLVAGKRPDALAEARFDGPPPRATHSDDGLLVLRYPRRLVDPRARASVVALNPSVEWSVDVAGGVTDLDGDLRSVRLGGLQLRGGVNHVDLSLGPADGAVRLSFAGGSSELFLSRPRGIGIDLRVRGGVSHLEFDGKTIGGVEAGKRLLSRGFDHAHGHYQVDIEGGVSHLKLAISDK